MACGHDCGCPDCRAKAAAKRKKKKKPAKKTTRGAKR